MEIKIIKGDITKLKIDAIVNATDSEMSGKGGVDGAIHRAAGLKLAEACKKLGGCKTGEAKITKGYNLPAKYVIHTVGSIYGKENDKEARLRQRLRRGEAELLANCYKNCLKLAKENNIRSIAFPAISTGVYGYPKKEAAQIALKSIKNFCDNNNYGFDEIIFAIFDDENYGIYKKIFLK